MGPGSPAGPSGSNRSTQQPPVPSAPRPLSNATNTVVSPAAAKPDGSKAGSGELSELFLQTAAATATEVAQVEENMNLMASITVGLTDEQQQEDGHEWEDLEEMTGLMADEAVGEITEAEDAAISDVAAKWMAIVDSPGSPEEDERRAGGLGDNIFAVDIVAAAPGLDALVEEEEEEEESLLEISLLPDETAVGVPQQEEEKVSSPWDRYIDISTAPGDDADEGLLRTMSCTSWTAVLQSIHAAGKNTAQSSPPLGLEICRDGSERLLVRPADSSPANSGITEIFSGEESPAGRNAMSNSTPDLLRKIGEFNGGGVGAENSRRGGAGLVSPAGKTPRSTRAAGMSPRRPPLRPRTNSAQLA